MWEMWNRSRFYEIYVFQLKWAKVSMFSETMLNYVVLAKSSEISWNYVEMMSFH